MTIGKISPDRYETPDGRRIAWQSEPARGAAPTFVWLSGFKSDMSGSKAQFVRDWAHANGAGFLAFDYSGHGASEGRFEDGTISHWRADTLALIDAKSEGPLVLVGSSMGGWMALLAALARPALVKALILIAPAPDFTEALLWPELSATAQAEILTIGKTLRPSDYGAPYPITRALIEDGKKWCLLGAPIGFDGPVHILQGMRDADVPWRHALRLAEALTTSHLTLTLIKDGEHRLSRDTDLAHLNIALESALAAFTQTSF